MERKSGELEELSAEELKSIHRKQWTDIAIHMKALNRDLRRGLRWAAPAALTSGPNNDLQIVAHEGDLAEGDEDPDGSAIVLKVTMTPELF